MLDEAVGPADTHHRDRAANLLQGLDHRRAEATHLHMILEGDEGGHAPGIPFEDFTIQRLDETRVDDRGREAAVLQPPGEFPRQGHHRPQAQNRYVGAVDQNFCLAHGDCLRLDFARHAGHSTARIADGARSRKLEGGLHHVGQLVLVLGSHQHDLGNAAQVGDVEQPMMSGTVVAGKPGAIHAEENRQLLQTNVMHDGVEGSL